MKRVQLRFIVYGAALLCTGAWYWHSRASAPLEARSGESLSRPDSVSSKREPPMSLSPHAPFYAGAAGTYTHDQSGNLPAASPPDEAGDPKRWVEAFETETIQTDWASASIYAVRSAISSNDVHAAIQQLAVNCRETISRIYTSIPAGSSVADRAAFEQQWSMAVAAMLETPAWKDRFDNAVVGSIEASGSEGLGLRTYLHRKLEEPQFVRSNRGLT